MERTGKEEMERGKCIDIFGMEMDGNTLYFSARYANGIFKMDMRTGIIEYIMMADRNAITDQDLYQDAMIDDKKLWFTPYSANNIMIYDLVQCTCEYIDIPKASGVGREHVKFCGTYTYMDWMILIPAEYPAILKVNKKTHEVTSVLWQEPLIRAYPHLLKTNRYLAIAWDFEVVGEWMYLLVQNIVIRYNMNTDEFSFNQVSRDSRMYTGIARYQNGFFLVDRMYSECLIWDEKNNTTEKIEIDLGYRGMENKEDGCPIGIIPVNKEIAIVQANADYILVVNEERKVQSISLEIGQNAQKKTALGRVKHSKEMLLIALDKRNQVLIVDMQDWSQRCITMDLEQLDFTPIRAKLEDKPYFIENEVYYQLTDFINHLENCPKKKGVYSETQQVGERIFAACCQ